MDRAPLKLLPVTRQVYQTISELNHSFGETVERLGQLTAFNIFPRERLQFFQVMIGEIRALTNEQLTETLNEREFQNSAHYGELRLECERQFEGAKDAPEVEPSNRVPQKPHSKKERSSTKKNVRPATKQGRAVRK